MSTLAKAYGSALKEDLRALFLAPLLTAIAGTFFWSVVIGLMFITDMAPWSEFQAGFAITFFVAILFSLLGCYAFAPVAWLLFAGVKTFSGPPSAGLSALLGAIVSSILVAAGVFLIFGTIPTVPSIFFPVYGAFGGYFYYKLTSKSKDRYERPV